MPTRPLLVAFAVLGLAAPARAQAPTPLPAYPTCLRASGPETTCAHSVQSPTSGPVRGVMMIIAAGGWSSRPALADGSDASIVETGQVWRDAGWATVLVEHTNRVVGSESHLGPRGVKDVAAWFDALRARTTQSFGADVPLCAFGQSSAGHVALLLGVARPALSCIVTEGAPTSLNGLRSGSHARDVADQAFDPTDAALRARFSPLTYSGSDASFGGRPILMGHLRDDDVVGISPHFTQFGSGMTNVTKQVLEPGPGCPAHPDVAYTRQFAHLCSDDPSSAAEQQGVVPASLAEWKGRETALADALGVAAPADPGATLEPSSPAAPAPATLGAEPVRARLLRTTRTVATLRLTNTESFAVTGTARLRAAAGNATPRSRTARFSLAPGARATVRLRLSPRARATLRRAGRLKAVVALDVTAGAEHRTLAVRVTLRGRVPHARRRG